MLIHKLRCFLRKRRFIIFTILLTSTFLMYQLLSVGQLGKELSKRKPRPKLQTNFKSYEKADGFMQVKYIDEEKKDISKYREKAVYNMKNVIGVLPANQKFYIPSDKNTFRCIHSGEEINFSWVNDNFCDCSDFTDEPSTSACNLGRFYCTHRSKHPVSIVSYKVNDGICDCCDGSDEWEQVILPEHTLVLVNKQKGIHQTPCPEHCIK